MAARTWQSTERLLAPHLLAGIEALLLQIDVLREAHEGMGESATVAIEVMFFVGFFLAVLLERALEE